MFILASKRTRPTCVLASTVALVCLFITACGAGAGSPTPTPTPTSGTSTPSPVIDFHPVLGEPFRLPINGSAFLNEHGYRITFLRVVSDNRCPVNVACVTGGAAVVEMSVRETADSIEQRFFWTIGPDSVEPSGWSIGGFVIELLEVQPLPGGTPVPETVLLLATRAVLLPLLTIDARATPSAIAVGDTFEVSTDAGGAGLPQYMLTVGDVGVSVVHHSGTEIQSMNSDLVTVLQFDANSSSARWTLRADVAGRLDVGLFVTGEVRAGEDGPWIFTHGTKSLSVNVSPDTS